MNRQEVSWCLIGYALRAEGGECNLLVVSVGGVEKYYSSNLTAVRQVSVIFQTRVKIIRVIGVISWHSC
jgi:hypothetical protein